MTANTATVSGPLQGLKVIEMGQLIAGPFAAKTLGDLGADVIKIEPPEGGDPLRQWRLIKDGTSVWWQVQSRNKRSIALDLRQPDGQAIARELIAQADVLVENFRPGTLEAWGMDYETLAATNPGLILLRISGYGQTGPYRDKPGFGVIGEAMGGLRHLTGEPGRVPAGSALPGIAPSNAYRCRDGQVLVAGNGDSIFRRLMVAISRPDLAERPDLASNTGRVASVAEIDGAIGQWTSERTVSEVLAALDAAQVPVGRIYTARDIAEDPHYRAREMILTQRTREGYDVEVPGIVPKLSVTPGGVRSPAPRLGEDTDAVLRELGHTDEQIAALRQRGLIR